MVAYNKFEAFVEHLAEKVHNLDTDAIVVLLSVDAPSSAADAVKADLTSVLANGNGYTGTGHDIQNTTSRTGGTLTVNATDVVITASGGTVGPFRYVIACNDTPASPADPLIGWWDYGSNLTLNDGESFTVDFGSNKLLDLS